MAKVGFVDNALVVLANTVNAIVSRDIEPTVFDQVLKHNPFLYRFWRKGPKKQGGSVLTWPVLTAAKTNGAFYTGSGTLPHGSEDTIQSAQVEWRHAAEDVTVPRTDLLRAQGPLAKVDLLKTKFDEAILNLRARLASASYTRPTLPSGGNDTLALDNLFEAIDDGTTSGTVAATYAGISHTNAYWKPGVTGLGMVNIGGAVSALGTLQTQYSEASDGDEQPTVTATTAKGFDFYWGQMQALQRYTTDEEMTKAGFENLKHNRAVVIVDRNMPAGCMLWINEAWVDLVSHEDENFVIDPIIPGTQDQRVLNTKIAWSGNWRVKIPRYQSKLIGATNF